MTIAGFMFRKVNSTIIYEIDKASSVTNCKNTVTSILIFISAYFCAQNYFILITPPDKLSFNR